MKDLRNASLVGRLSFLSEGDKRDIYLSALEIMSKVGMVVYHEGARRMLLEAGCVLLAESRVLMPRHLVETARLSVPSQVDVYDRDGELAMELGGYNSYFGTGSDLMSTYDLDTGEHRPSTLEDVARAARLCDALPNMDFIMSSAHPTDRNPHHSYLLSFQAMVKNSRKPLVMTAENAGDLQVMIDVARALRGGVEELRRRPYFVVYNEPISPLEHPVESIEKLLLCADSGVPSIYSPAPLAGATAPITVAGHTTQGVAECLFGLVIHQLHKPGAPFLFGIGPAVLDLVTAQSSYNAVEYLMTYMCAVEMAKWLDIPNWGYAGTSDSHLLDAQAGMEATQLTFLAMQAGSNLSHDVGYLDFGLTASLEEIVVVDEFISMNRRLLRGIPVDRDTLAVEAVAEIGPGGHFMTSDHTYRHMREVQWRPTILNRHGRDRWLADGSLDLAAKARRKAQNILDTHEVPALAPHVAAALGKSIEAFTSTEG
ncbi:MAG TPA: trimethylamine methyltransferase family protein [Thermoleophilia bacterium]|nr:trimethylamine methyltransferase family protein [Thermoleophilia bacterium]